VGGLVLTGSLAVHLTGRVLLLAVDRAYEGVGGGVGVGVGSVLELFIKHVTFPFYVQSFERSRGASGSYRKEPIVVMVAI
jgi:hypothetical protein